MPETLDDVLTGGPEAKLFRKISEVMGEVGRVEKRGRNDFHKYDYVTEADLVEAVREKLAARQVAILPSVDSVEAGGKNGTLWTYRGAFTFVDGESGAMFRCTWAGQGEDQGDKGLYKAYTGALKYFLMKTFLIPTGDDPEGDSETDRRAAKPSAVVGKGVPKQRPGVPASEKQKAFRQTLIAEKKPTVSQIRLILNTIGVADQPQEQGELHAFIDGLDGANTSAFIEQLKDLPRTEPIAA